MNAETLDKAVEAAAKALWISADEMPEELWLREPEWSREVFRKQVRPLVEAAARPIAEAAWDEGYEAGFNHVMACEYEVPAPTIAPANPYAEEDA